VNFDRRIIFYKEFVVVFMTYIFAEFTKPGSSDSLVIAIKPKTEHNIHAAAFLLWNLHKGEKRSFT
jgi:hypothetical protein